jgi:hypothetical protein
MAEVLADIIKLPLEKLQSNLVMSVKEWQMH